MIPVVGRRMNLLLASSPSLSVEPLLPPPPSPPPMWIHTCSCVQSCFPCSRLPSDSSRNCSNRAPPTGATSTACWLLRSIDSLLGSASSPFPHRHQGIGLESSCRLDSATCSFRGQFCTFLINSHSFFFSHFDADNSDRLSFTPCATHVSIIRC